MEIAQLCVDAGLADNGEVLAEAEMLAMDPDPQPERIVELWNRLRGESGSTPYESPSDSEPSLDIRDKSPMERSVERPKPKLSKERKQ